MSLDICSAEQEAQRACPDGSKIGSAAATASVLALPVQLTGTVHYGGPAGNKIKLIVFLNNDMLNQHQTIEGFVELRSSDFGFDTVFDGLPNTLTTSFTLSLDGAPRSLATNPAKCGDYAFNGAFTSQNGEQATSSSTVTIAGCTPPKLVMSPLDLAPERPRAGRRGTSVSFGLNDVAAVTLYVEKAGNRVATYRAAGKVGNNTIRRVGRKLKRGRYIVRVSARTTDGRTAGRRKTLFVRRAAR